MKNVTEKKMDSLKKYVPFIDFVLKIDPQKYVKFSNIKKWIMLRKKNYPLSDLNKIEQSILTQYKNLLLEKKVQIPQNITNIFAPLIFNQFVNLCSDDEDEIQNSVTTISKPLDENNAHSNTNRKHSKPKIGGSGDDDLEIVSIDYVGKTKGETEKEPLRKSSITKVISKEETSIDEASRDILSRIDQLAADDLKMKNRVHEPNNYTYKKENECSSDSTKGEEVIYQRRTINSDLLFKRRADFDDEVIVESLLNKNSLHIPAKTSVEIISLDSGSDSEDERPSTSKASTSNKVNTVAEKVGTITGENEQVVENADSNSNSTNKTDKRCEMLCNSIDSVLPDMNDLLDDSKDGSNDSNTNLCNKQMEGGSDKENTVNTKNTPDLTPEEISKLMEDISSKTDLDWEIFYEFMKQLSQTNSKEGGLSETPPPAPPLNANNLPASTMQPCYAPQQPAQLTSPFTSHYPQNSNIVPIAGAGAGAGARPPMPKPNFNDPRIRKQLHLIRNSPLFTYNVLNVEIEESIRKMHQSQTQQQPQPQQQIGFPNSTNSNKNNMVPSFRNLNSTHKSPISYGEYKRRQLQNKLEMERQREEERKAKAKSEMERERELEREREREREKLELVKNKDESIRSKLLSTLGPCKEQLTTLWSQQKNSTSNPNPNIGSNMEKEQQEENNNRMSMTSSWVMNTMKSNNTKKEKNKLSKNYKIDENSSQNKNKNADKKRNRVYNELKCTVKGFDHIQDYVAEESLNISSENKHPSDTAEVLISPKSMGYKRRSSIHARSAILLQLDQQSSDGSDSEFNSKRHVTSSSSENLSEDFVQSSPKRRKTIDEIMRPAARSKTFRITDDDDTSSVQSSSDEGNINKVTREKIIIKKAYVKLDRMSDDFIRKHTKRLNENTCSQSIVDEQSIKLKKACEKVKNLKEPGQKLPKLKKYNNDCQMTERNTVFCVLCRSKPSDLTNHYIGRHKTESYVARLDWSEIEDLAINTPFAKLQTKNKNSRFERYEVECPFCKEQLCDHFINLYNHYSAHTGEYAFQCSNCYLCKPYRPDIQSHILHSKACRNSPIQVMYRYPPQAQCIYLHYCTICNFVQLNEANVLKHLREHHDPSKAIASNVQKTILAAMSDGPDGNQTNKSPSPTPILKGILQQEKTADITAAVPGEVNQLETKMSVNEIKFKVDDDDILVSNEPCLEDEYLEEPLQEHLKQMHNEPSIANTPIPMTVIHCSGNRDSPHTVSRIANINSTEEQTHLAMKIKTEAMNVGKKVTMSQSANQPVLENNLVYEKYRCYPPNVSYLGLYKCMIDDCYYSTDCSEEMVKHLTEHYTDELRPNECLQCPYCAITLDIPINPMQLVEHVRIQHGHLNFQCSRCCYRSSSASNVYIHQEMYHNSDLNTCRIFKCSSDVVMANNSLDLDKQIAKGIFKISCKICNAGFYYTQFLVHHLHTKHMVHNSNGLQIYSCIYCPLMVDNKIQIKIHVATKHPGEQPLAYDHNKQINYNEEDIKSTSNIVDLSETVSWSEVTPTVTDDTNEEILQDLKPDFQELLRINEENVKVRLQKLTTHTGVSPDCLYRCAERICGGFFSNFELWLKHMKVRHHTFECVCPHCQTELLMPLEQFALHFEQHRRHTFICFYCSTTSPSEILARQHATDNHSDFEPMRFENIDCNISYSYSIMIQRDLFKERERFIVELLSILENRLKELESIEIKKLKQQWPVQDNTPWIDDYLEIFSKRKVALRCLVQDCNFRTLGEESLYQHLSTSHTISGTQFNCSKCDYQVEKCNNLDELFNHIKLHNEYIFICAACSVITPSRTRMSSHIREQHSARDVPVIHLFRTSKQMYIQIYIVFADNHLSFSTIKNCFCCSEQNMSGDVFGLHLKHYHKLSLNYYCEKCNNFSFNSLKEVKPHFEQLHNSNNFKISCELAGHNDLNVVSLTDFQVQILTNESVLQHVKNEPVDASDSDVIFMEDNDVEITNSLREEQLKQAQRPQLKCASLSKLIDPSTNLTLTVPSIKAQPPFLQSHFLPINQDAQQFSAVSALPPTNVVAQTSYDHYNWDPTTINSSINISNSLNLNSIPTSSTASNSAHIGYNDTVLPSYLPNNNIPMPIGLFPPHAQAQVNVNAYMHVPNSLYMPQSTRMQKPIHINTSIPYLIPPQHCSSVPTQNPTNNC